MKRRSWWWMLIVGAVVLIGLAVLRQRSAPRTEGFDPKAAALARFEEVHGEGTDLSRGPCLGVIGPDWVADIVHDPRTAADDNPANQCAEYREGKASHFVEITPQGRIVRVR